MALRIRKNQATLTATEKQRFTAAVLELKRRGVYDNYVNQHAVAGHHAHRHPGFLPWHREYLRRFELDLQGIDPTVTLPYWDWTVDNSPAASLWAADMLGGNGRAGDRKVMDGPFAFDSGSWTCIGNPAFLRREFGVQAASLPTTAHVTACLGVTPYDRAPWDQTSNPSFRNELEGWIGPGRIHNRVHLWVGGSMAPLTSPNDPVFFLHHCNVDRLWAQWQRQHPAEPYVPTRGAPAGHNLNDSMQPWGGSTTVASTLDHRALGYTYDSELVLWPLPAGPLAQGNDMRPGEILSPEKAITSADGRFTLIYQGDGNLVLYGPAGPLWASATDGTAPGVCIMQGDGNLVIYDVTVWPVWSSETWQHPGSHVVAQDDGNLVIYRPDGAPVWSTNTQVPTGPLAQGNDMQPGEILSSDKAITSPNGRYTLIYQADGNLVLYGPAGPLWASATDGRPPGACIMQGDGNLVIYGPGLQYIWDSATDNNPGAHLVVQDDGNLVIYRPDGTPIWATDTVQP